MALVPSEPTKMEHVEPVQTAFPSSFWGRLLPGKVGRVDPNLEGS